MIKIKHIQLEYILLVFINCIMFNKLRFLYCGDTAITVEIGSEITTEINSKVIALYEYLKESKIKGINEVMPAYCSITIFYDPIECDLIGLKVDIENKFQNIKNKTSNIKDVIDIPVIYGGEYGPDLEIVAKYNKLTKEDVIKIHSMETYLVYMIGFTPGFPYLGGMNSKISTPRLNVPRKRILSGSVGIAGNQTGIYPLESPGGWNIIGQTPMELFKPNSDSPVLLTPGNYVRFKPIEEKVYIEFKNKKGA